MQVRSQIEELILEHKTQDAIQFIEKEVKSLTSVINEPNGDGLTLLQIAAREGLDNVVTHLCFLGAKITPVVEVKSENEVVQQNARRIAASFAEERGHTYAANVLQAFIANPRDNFLKAIYMWAIKHYPTPEGLVMPVKPSLLVCQGLFELAAFLNKREWAEEILSYYENFIFRHNANVRTAAYWAARHHDDALFQKLTCKDENHLLLTIWQLKEEGFNELFDKYYTTGVKEIENIFDRIPEDKEAIASKYKKAYLATTRANNEFVKKFNYDTQCSVMCYALGGNNFVALSVIQDCLMKRNFEFLTSSLHSPELIIFELISKNQCFYDFVFTLDTKRHQDFITTPCNKIGLLNYLISSHIIKGCLTEEESAFYNSLSKTDSVLIKLAENHISDRKANLHRIVLFKDLGLPWASGSKTIKNLSDKLITSIFQFLIKDKKDRKNIAEAHRRFHALIQGVNLSDQIQLSHKTSEIKLEIDTKDELHRRLTHEIQRLEEFKNLIHEEARDNAQCGNRCCFSWSACGCLTVVTGFIGNVFCIVQLGIKKAAIAAATKAITWGRDDSCYYYYKRRLDGCNTGYPDNICDKICDQAWYADMNYGYSVLTAVLLAAGVLIGGPFLLCGFKMGWRGECNTMDYEINKWQLSIYSNELRRKIPEIAPLFFNPPFIFEPINTGMYAREAIQRIDEAIARKTSERDNIPTDRKHLQTRQTIFQRHLSLFKPVEEKKENKLDLLVDIFEDEPPKVSHIGSVNNVPTMTPLLQRKEDEQPQRKSHCPCVIL